MHAVARFYSGPGAKELFDILEANKADVEKALRGVSGFVGYTLFRADEGGASVTVCQDKAGADRSVEVAREWVQKNAAHTHVAPPGVSEGEVILHLT